MRNQPAAFTGLPVNRLQAAAKKNKQCRDSKRSKAYHASLLPMWAGSGI
jgi:hypothetical protein